MRWGRWRYAAGMSNAHLPRRRGHAGRAAAARFVEVETIPGHGAELPGRGLLLEFEGLRIVVADEAALALLAGLFRMAGSGGKGGRR